MRMFKIRMGNLFSSIGDWFEDVLDLDVVSSSEAPHLAAYFNEMARSDKAMIKKMSSDNVMQMNATQLEAHTQKIKEAKQEVAERLKVHARAAFKKHDKDKSGTLDVDESKVTGLHVDVYR